MAVACGIAATGVTASSRVRVYTVVGSVSTRRCEAAAGQPTRAAKSSSGAARRVIVRQRPWLSAGVRELRKDVI